MSRAVAALALVGLVGCAALPPASLSPRLASRPSTTDARASAVAAPPSPPDRVGAVILPGRPPALASSPPAASRSRTVRSGDIRLDFSDVDVQAVAQAVLGDVLGAPYVIAPDLHTPVTLQPGRRLARKEVLPAFETALRAAGLALVAEPGGGFNILPLDQARAVAPVNSGASVGFASEAIRLNFVNAEQLRRLIDPVLPGVVTGADPGANVLTIAGSEGQRAAARDLVRQFDVNWLRGASFGLFIPRRTDARLIVPELDKLLNADGAPTRNLVRLIAMERLNGILAVSTQPQYLEDVRRWVEILDREGENNTRRLFVYNVQNGRARDLARVLASAFGQSSATGTRGGVDAQDRGSGAAFEDARPGLNASLAPNTTPGLLGSAGAVPGAVGSLSGTSASTVAQSSVGTGAPASQEASADLHAGDFRARITSDEVNNAIVVFATPRDYAIVEDALRNLDITPNQVMIEAAITEVTLTDALRFGVQGLYSNRGTSVGLTESATSALPVQDLPGFSAFYSARSISAALNSLEGLTKIKVVSAPKLMVLNNQTASIEVGNQVPILTGSATSVITANAPVVNSVDYRDTGIILKITPRVNSSGVVLLDLAQEVSDVIAAGQSSSIDSPTISTRRIATSVAAHNGQVIALGGLIRDSRNDATSGLPLLSRIPVLGPLLFGSINNAGTRTELVVLLRATVVRSADDARAVTDEMREKLRGLRGQLSPGVIP